ncbi:MAG: DNA polymerase IV [Tissierellia bacterium]|nr:DNA polymerase IV [Tissierellia bacterium]
MKSNLNIMHIDMDAFYASCEELINPNLKYVPMAVGGLSSKSIITTANYKARKYGIHSAMPVFMAKEKCPKLIIMPLRRKLYSNKSKEVFDIVKKYSIVFEKVSIDEAYLEINEENVLDLAKQIKKEIKEKTKLTASIGISYNKFFAKLASDWNKPNGIKIITKEESKEILKNLDIRKIHGIGSKTATKLYDIGIYKVRDLLKLDYDYLKSNFGKHGIYIYNVIRGNDNRKVTEKKIRKSIGEETTFKRNTNDKVEIYKYMKDLAYELENKLKEKNISGKTVNIKIKTADFKIHTKSHTFQEKIEVEDIYIISKNIFDSFYNNEYLRLIGISISSLSSGKYDQLSFL